MEQVVQENFLFQYLAAYSSALNVMSSGQIYGWSSPTLPKLLSNHSAIPFTNGEGSWLAVMPLLGALIGSTIGAFTVDTFGRKRMILVSTVPFFISWILIGVARSAGLIFTARLLSGISDGLSFTSVPIYIGEIADSSIRGLLGTSTAILFLLGLFVINALGLFLSIQLTAFVSSIIPVITFIAVMLMPESPYYLVKQCQLDDARRSLQKLRGTADVDKQLQRISLAIQGGSSSSKKIKLWDLFTVKENRKAVFIMMLLRGTQQFCGHMPIIFYAQTIFIEAGDQVSSEAATLIFFFVQLLVTLVSSALVDRLGRRPLLINSCIASAFFLLVEGVFFFIKSNTRIDVSSLSIVPLIGLIGFIVVFSLGMGTIPIMMLGELFSSEVKAYALWYADVYFALVATLSSKLFQITKDSLGMYAPFIAFTLFALVGLGFIIGLVPETKGKTLEDIQELFRGEKVDDGSGVERSE